MGRGCLFGPVFAAAVILSPARAIYGLRDSKILDPERREELDVRIRRHAIAWSVASVSTADIDRINIYQASRLAMKLAVEALMPAPHHVLVDALALDIAVPQQSLIKGDTRSRAIAAASIVAKVARDREMREYDRRYPGYGLASNKGYCTPDHVEALARLGPTPEHRQTFSPVRQTAFRFESVRCETV